MANDINSLTIVGRLTRDCGQQDFSYLQSGTAVAKIGIAVNRGKKQADGSFANEASFFDVTVFGKTAENLRPYLQKGKQVAIKGYLKQDRWQDKQTGQNRSSVGIVAEEIQLIGGQPQGGQNQGYNPQTVYPTAQAARLADAQQDPMRYAPPQGYQQAPQPTVNAQNTAVNPYQQNQQQYQPNFPPPTGAGFPEDIPF